MPHAQAPAGQAKRQHSTDIYMYTHIALDINSTLVSGQHSHRRENLLESELSARNICRFCSAIPRLFPDVFHRFLGQ